MSFFGKWNVIWLAALLLAAGYGCSPMDSGATDEEKEPHFVLGKSRLNAMDYPGAIAAFEDSLEANPHSAQAHFQLAMLFENQESDPAAAIYHYQQYLKFDPKTEKAEIIVQHIASCKQQLAADVLQLPSAPATQQQLEKLTEENRRLHDQLTAWAQWAAQQAAKTNQPIAQTAGVNSAANSQPVATSPTPDDITPQAGPSASGSQDTRGGGAPAPTRAATPPKSTTVRAAPFKTHVVQRGETMASIARKHGVSLSALQGVNPSVSPKKLKTGQVLNLPVQ